MSISSFYLESATEILNHSHTHTQSHETACVIYTTNRHCGSKKPLFFVAQTRNINCRMCQISVLPLSGIWNVHFITLNHMLNIFRILKWTKVHSESEAETKSRSAPDLFIDISTHYTYPISFIKIPGLLSWEMGKWWNNTISCKEVNKQTQHGSAPWSRSAPTLIGFFPKTYPSTKCFVNLLNRFWRDSKCRTCWFNPSAPNFTEIKWYQSPLCAWFIFDLSSMNYFLGNWRCQKMPRC